MGFVSAEILITDLDKRISYSKGKGFLVGRNGTKHVVKSMYCLILKGFIQEKIHVEGGSSANILVTVGDVNNLLSAGSVKVD